MAKRQQPVLELAWKHPGSKAFKKPQEWEPEQEELKKNAKPESIPNHDNSSDKRKDTTVQDKEKNR